LQENLTFSCITVNIPLASPLFPDISLQSLDLKVSIPVSEISMSASKQPNIAIISTIIFIHTSKLPGSSKFQLYLCSLGIQTNSAQLAEASNLSNIPSEYHKFANVFSKTKAEVIAPHCSYNLQINLDESAQHPVGPIYSFVKKKDSSLCLYIDFCSLNFNFKKNHYPLLLISDLLDSPHKAQVYIKIDLYYAYHLVCIADGNE